MLESAAALFHRQGYHGTGLTQLLTEGGLPKGSLYFHFPGGKQQLAAEALALSGERMREALLETLRQAPDVGRGVEAAVELFASALEESDFRQGCPLSTVALEAAGESEEIRNACAASFAGWESTIAEALADAGLDETAAARLATVAIATVEGALLLAKTRRDLAPLRAAAAHLRDSIERELS